MSGKQARRPPVAPKPSFIQQNAASKASPLPSPALRGAASAFAPGQVKVPNVTASHNPSASGALLAATAAASRKKHEQQNAPQEPLSVPRGRALTTERLPVAVSGHASTSPSRPPAFRPHPPRSTSAVAAVAASAKTSPARRPEPKRDPSGTYLTKRDLSQVRGRGMSSSSNSEAVPPLPQNAAALAGAKASVKAAPVQAQSVTGDKQRSELAYLSLLNVQSPQTSLVSSSSPTGTAAAARASRNAATLEARRRALSTSEESSPKAPVHRNTTLSPAPFLDPARFRTTPPHTDSESDSVRPVHTQSQRSLPAPIPLRPSRAAIVAQEQARATNSNSPILDSRTKMTASSLADAMVAGSLASTHQGSRVGSPSSKKVPPPVPRRRSKSVGVFEGGRHLMHLPGMRSDAGSQTPKLKPLPARPMRHTLRKTSPSRDEPVDEKRGRRHWRRHPNMHHEGDRKRWRDKVTERERKRYEGVWAANRGVLLDYDLDYLDLEHRKDGTPVVDLVVNVVVRDIWERSRLPGDVLEEIWDLVSQPDAKTLNREEFVVGLWLIDQRLKGRKLPFKVSTSVWSSVRHPQGVKISSRRLQK